MIQPSTFFFLLGLACVCGCGGKVDTVENRKELALAASNCMQAVGKLTNVEKDGKQLLSWRVQLLPYLEETDLFKKLKHDEAWDSENNKPLAKKTPHCFITASAPEPGMTSWRLVPKESSAVILAIDAGKGKHVPWTQPDDFTIDPVDALASFGEEPTGGYGVILRIGAQETMTGDELKAHFVEQAKSLEEFTEKLLGDDALIELE